MLPKSTGFKPRKKPLARGKGLCSQSRKRRREQAAQSKAYAAADDAEQVWCSCCGRVGSTEHSHHFTQHQQKELANDSRNWIVVGKYCGCHRLFENKKALFAATYPQVWLQILAAMREVSPAAYAKFCLKNAHLIPNDLLP